MESRTLHVIDIENLLTHRRRTIGVDAVRGAFARYQATCRIAADDLVLTACRPDLGLVVGLGMGRGQLLVRGGRDGADLALLDSIDADWVAERFDRAVVATGDGIFAPLVERLRAQGVEVVVVSHLGKLSRRLVDTGARVLGLKPIRRPEAAIALRPAALGLVEDSAPAAQAA